MAERLPEKELYDLVWSEPLKTLCSRFGISDVALKNTCAGSGIPTPERGFWAKKDAGKPTFRVRSRYVRPVWMIGSSLPEVKAIGTRIGKGLGLFLRLLNSLSQSKQCESAHNGPT
jgi:hypothetical protein